MDTSTKTNDAVSKLSRAVDMKMGCMLSADESQAILEVVRGLNTDAG